MKTIINFFTSNFGLKILALILALIVYLAVRDSLVGSRGSSSEPQIFKRARRGR